MGKGNWPIILIQGVVIIFLIAGFYFPLINFFFSKNPIEPENYILNWDYLIDFLSDSWNLNVVWFSFYQAFWSAVLAVLLGFPGAWILSHYDFPGKRFFRIFSYLPFILPSILVVLGMVLFFGNNGVVNQTLMWIFELDNPPFQFLYSLQGIFIAHVFYNFPIAMKTIGDHWDRQAPQYSIAAQSLGVGQFKIFFKIQLPLLFPSIISSFILIFLLCLNSFAIVLVLGGGVRYTNIEVLIYQLVKIDLDFNGAASLATLQLVISMFFLFSLFRSVSNPVKQSMKTKKHLLKELMSGSKPALLSILWLLILVFFAFGPLVSIVLDSLRELKHDQWIFTFKWYQQLFTMREGNTFLTALWNSLKIGIGSACLSSFIGIGMVSVIHQKKGLTRKFWELIVLLPVGVSTILFGVVWFFFFQNILTGRIPMSLLLVLVHAILIFPYWVRVVLPALDSVPPGWLMVSQSLGRTNIFFYIKVLLPWLKRVFIIGFFFSFSLSLGELNSTFMLTDDSVQTLPLEIYRAIGSYRFALASAIGVVLLLLSVITFLIIEEWFE